MKVLKVSRRTTQLHVNISDLYLIQRRILPKHDLRSDLLVTLEVSDSVHWVPLYVRLHSINYSGVDLFLDVSFVFLFPRTPQPQFSQPRQSGARPPGGSCQRSCEIVKGRAERLTWQRLLGALCWRKIPPSPLPTCEDATITYWQWAGVVSPDVIYSRLAERKGKENRKKKKKTASVIGTDWISSSSGIW